MPTGFLLATVSASDELNPDLGWCAIAVFILAGVLVFVGMIGMAFFPADRILWKWILVGGAGLSLFPLTFSIYVYEIDFVAVGGDGTLASEPIWRVLWFPSIPLILALLTIGWHFWVAPHRWQTIAGTSRDGGLHDAD